MKTYVVHSIFYTLQGEGVRSGTANVFVRFAGCNQTCNGTVEGEAYRPVCDTEFSSGTPMTAEQIVNRAFELVGPNQPWSVIFTGGEPALQLDDELLNAFKEAEFYTAIETNGTISLPNGIDWVCVSPKTAEHTLKVLRAHEVKYVRSAGMTVPNTRVVADHYLLSPAFSAVAFNGIPAMEPGALATCVELCKQNPKWRLSVQFHKTWNIA